MKRFRKILLYVDAAQGDSAAFRRAVRLCERTGAKLTLLAVVPELSVYLRYPQLSYPSLDATLEEDAGRALGKLTAEARERGVDVSTALRRGKAFLEIAKEALASQSGLVMLTAEDESSLGRSTSTAMQLFRVCPCPVWAVRPKHAGPYRRILAAVDPGAPKPEKRDLNLEILDLALSLGEIENARVDALHAWQAELAGDELRAQIGEAARESLEELLTPYASSLPPENVHLVEGNPPSAISSFVEENGVDLLVMGTVVRTGVAGFLIGNTAERALSKVDCSVLALKPEGFVSPVEEEAQAEKK